MRTVLITGATGAIGSALVPLFLAEEGTVIRLAIRARSKSHLAERLGRLVEFWNIDPADRLISSRLEAFCGDVSRPRLGLDEADYGRLVEEVTHVVHAAGDVKLNQKLEEARRSAVDTTHHIVAFAKACHQAGRFQKLEFVSTVGVAGRMPGLVPEEPLRLPRGFRNFYEAAKAEAEDLLVGEMEAGLPATIYRPSMVVGDSRTGKIIHFQVFYYLSELLAGRKSFGIIPDTGEVALDIIPVDYVARAMYVASRREDAVGRIFHLCAGPQAALRISEMAERLRAIFTGYGERLFRLRRVSPAWVRRVLPFAILISPAGVRRVLQRLPFFLAYLDQAQWFDNGRTQEFFSREGPFVPAVGDYLEQVMAYYRSVRQTAPSGTL